MIRSILLVIALVSGGGALVLLMQGPATSAPEITDTADAEPVTEAAAPEEEAVAPPVVETSELLSVARDIAEGETLRPDDFAWVAWPTDFLISGFIARDDAPDAIFDLIGTVAAFDLAEGEPVLAEGFEAPQVADQTGAFDAAVRRVGAGMRPVSVPVEVVRPLGSVLRPGDHVDLVHVYFPDDGDVPVSRILVPDAQILAIDPVGRPDAEGRADEGLRNVVLALSVRDATAALAATRIGSLSLLLRHPDDVGRIDMPRQPDFDLARDIASGLRGFALSDVDLAAAGQILPDDRVDLIFTPGPEDDLWPSSRVLVTNARVVGLSAALNDPDVVRGGSGPDGGPGTPSDRVTVELDPAGVEAVTTALQRGRVSVSLRSDSETDLPYHVNPLPPPSVQVRVRRAGEL